MGEKEEEKNYNHYDHEEYLNNSWFYLKGFQTEYPWTLQEIVEIYMSYKRVKKKWWKIW